MLKRKIDIIGETGGKEKLVPDHNTPHVSNVQIGVNVILDSPKGKVMIENPSYKLNIGGHTDDVGDDAMNMTLSQNRADAVANYLISHGVNPMKVTAKGFGETLPVDTNKSEKGRTRNRRVEFKVEFLK